MFGRATFARRLRVASTCGPRQMPATRNRLFKPTRNDTESIRELPSTDRQQDWSAQRFPSVKPAKRAFRVPRTRRSVSGVARQARRAGMETRLRARRPVLRSTQCVGGSLEREDAATDRSRRKPTDAHASFRGRAQREDDSDSFHMPDSSRCFRDESVP